VRPESLPERVARHQALEFAGNVSVPADGQVGFDPGLQRVEAKLFQPAGGIANEVHVDSGHGRTAPQRQGLRQRCCCPVRVGPEVAPALRQEPLEAERVHVLGTDVEHVTP
jgi:hypothetical protein